MSGKFLAEIDFCEGCKWLKYRPTAEYDDCSKCTLAAGRRAGIDECLKAVMEMQFHGYYDIKCLHQKDVISVIKMLREK